MAAITCQVTTAPRPLRYPFRMSAPQAFGDLLKTWRKSRGFSQMDLAERADVSARHLSFLETGRAGPSREMVLRLCRFLEVPLRERNALLEAAGFSATFQARSWDDEQLAPVRWALETLLAQHEPWGAILCDRTWRLRMVNRPFRTLLEGLVGELPEPLSELNIMRLFFDPDLGVRPRIKNYDAIAPHLLEQVRQDARAPGAPRELAGLAEELERLAGPLGEATGPWLPLVPMIIDAGVATLSLYTAVTTLGSPLDVTLAELRMETYFPADDGTRAFLEQLTPRA